MRFTSIVLSQRGTSTSIVGPAYGFVAALLMRISTLPNVESVAWTARSMSSIRPALPASNAKSPPVSSVISFTASSHTSALRLVIITFAPAEANSAAIALPIPREPPVTIATFPFKSVSMCRLYLLKDLMGRSGKRSGNSAKIRSWRIKEILSWFSSLKMNTTMNLTTFQTTTNQCTSI